jgi:hypothetical protein
MESRLAVFGIGLFVLGILLLAYLLRKVVKRIRYRDTGEAKMRAPGGASIFLIILALLSIILAQGFFWLSSQLKYFRPLSNEGTIGRLAVNRTDDPIKSLEIRYVPASGHNVSVENMFYLSGDSWRFSGEILRFKFARNQFGLPEKAFKTTEFNGRFIARRAPSSTGALLHSQELEGGQSAAFEFFRDTRLFKWFAEVDSFATDWVTVEDSESYELAVGKDGGVSVE